MRRRLGLAVASASAIVCLVGAHGLFAARPSTGVITGTVTSASGAEAGVWVIAETDELETVYRKIVVTDDDGRFLLPEMPDVRFSVWVRGYGLVDSIPVPARPEQDIDLTVTVAPSPQAAAAVYPANYWLSLIDLPEAHEFPGTGESGNGINPELKSQGEWINNLKGCQRCHQVGSLRTRDVPDIQNFDSTLAAWNDRVQRGQRGALMNSFMTRFGRQRGLEMVSDWTDRIAAGAVPEAPPRPTGIERNVVLTMWNWGDSVAFVHDEIATDKRDPTINANGPIYGVDIGNDFLLVTDPGEHHSTMLKIPLRAPRDSVQSMFTTEGFKPWRDFGERAVWNDPANPHNPMLDSEGRVWLTTRVRAPENPDWCREQSDNPFAQYFPIERAGRHAGYFDPRAQKFVLIDTCFGTHHLQFAEDEHDTLYSAGAARRSGGSTRGCTTRPAMSAHRRAGARRFSIPTATAPLPNRGTSHRPEARQHQRQTRRSIPAWSSARTASLSVRLMTRCGSHPTAIRESSCAWIPATILRKHVSASSTSCRQSRAIVRVV